MPRFGSVCDDSVCRVPKLTNVSIVWRSCASLTGATMLRRRASGDGGGAAPIKATLAKAINLRIATLPLDGEGATGICLPPGLGEPRSQNYQLRTRNNASQHRPFHRRF